MSFSTYRSLCDAIVLLMAPLVEVVIHDRSSNTICYINGALSNRKLGDPSLIELDAFDDKNLDKKVYSKVNFNGKLLKSISIPVDGKWLICINVDVSVFRQLNTWSEMFLKSIQTTQPESLFKSDWQEKVHRVLEEFLEIHNLRFEALKKFQKKQIAKHLFDLGAFCEKNAAEYIARTLSLGRATMFKYLKEWRI